MLGGGGREGTTKPLPSLQTQGEHPPCQPWKTSCVTFPHSISALLLRGTVSCVEKPTEKQCFIEMLMTANANRGC